MRTALLTLLLPLAACSSTPTTHFSNVEPMNSLESIHLDYKGAYSSQGLPDPEFKAYAGESAKVGRVRVKVRIYEVEPSAIPGLVQADGVQLRADRVNRKEAMEAMQALLTNGGAELHGNPQITLNRGSRANISAETAFSYVESFEMKPFGVSVLGDPKISTGHEGFQIEVAPALVDEEGQSTFDVKLSLASVLRPIQNTELQVPGSNGSMSIQIPIYSTQELQLHATLSASESLLVGPLPPISVDGLPIMVLVNADSMPLPADSASSCEHVHQVHKLQPCASPPEAKNE